MAYLLGTIVGGSIAVFLIAALWEWILFKRIFDDPIYGKMSSVVAAWLTVSILAGFGFADGGPFAFGAFAIYAIPAVLVGILYYRQAVAIRDESDGQ